MKRSEKGVKEGRMEGNKVMKEKKKVLMGMGVMVGMVLVYVLLMGEEGKVG